MSKQQKSVISVYLITFILYNLVFFIIPFPKTTSSWITYFFTFLAFFVSFAITAYAFNTNDSLRSKLYGFPVFRIGMVYLIIQVIFSVIFSVIGCFANPSVWISIIVSIMLLGLTLVGVIATDNARDIIEEQDTKIIEKTKIMKYLTLDIENICASCQDQELKKKLNALSEKLKYSDPVSGDKLEKIENQIQAEIKELANLINIDTFSADMKISQIDQLLDSRNRMCKAFK